MYTHVDRFKSTTSKAVANSLTQKKTDVKQGCSFDKSWSDRNPKRCSNELINQRKEDNKMQSIIQKKTNITHTARDFTYSTNKKDKVGVEMEAYLDPHDQVVGSETGTPQKALYDAVNAKTQSSMVRGHLLNHDLGGFGVAENLYPITTSANSKHKFYVENPVQKELDKAQRKTTKSEHDNDQGKGVFYHVRVDNLQLTDDNLVSNPVQFVCTVQNLTNVGTNSNGNKGAALLKTTITSDTQGVKSGDRGKATDTESGLDPTVKVTTKIIPSGWDHGTRKGSENFDDLKGDKITVVNGDQQQTLNTTSGNTTSKQQGITEAINELISNISEINSTLAELNQLKNKLSTKGTLDNLTKDFDYSYSQFLVNMINNQITTYNTFWFKYDPVGNLGYIIDNCLWALHYLDLVIARYDA